MAGPAGHGKTAWLLSTQQRALYKTHGSAMRNLSLWISSCVHYIRDWFSVGILSTKPLTVWKTPGCVAAAEHSRTDWEGNTTRFEQHRAAGLNISVWFRATKEKDLCFLPSSSGLSAIGLVSLSWLTTECILLHIQWLEKKYWNTTLEGAWTLKYWTTKAQLHRPVIWRWLTVFVGFNEICH